MILYAIIPFALILILILIFKLPAIKAMPIVLTSTFLITLKWGVQSAIITASIIKSLILFVEIFLLILFAVTFLEILKRSNKLKTIETYLSSITKDKRVLAMLIAWAFVSLIEGASGFGTPVAIAAPFLVAIGFPAVTAIAIGLIGDSTAVTFGAAGTPIIIGLASSGLTPFEIILATKYASLLHLFLAIIATIAITIIVDKKNYKEFIPFAIFSAFAFTIPFYLTVIFIGPELPSIIGGIVAILLISIAARKGFLLKQKTKNKHGLEKKQILKAIYPFLLLTTLLIISRTIPQIKQFLQSKTIGITNILATPITQNLAYLYTPGFFFLLTILLLRSKHTIVSLKDSYQKIKIPMLTLLMILITTQLILNSNININDLPGIPQIIATELATTLGKGFVIISPLLGALGAFITGSSTVSNLLLASIQTDTALTLGISAVLLTALQLIGSAAGNMVALHNIVSAQATLGLKTGEHEILKKTILPALLYSLIAGIIIYLII
jgi:lactate permease